MTTTYIHHINHLFIHIYFFLANEFPSSFESIVRKIVRLLFHVIAHLYAAHFREVVLLGLHAHLNLTFAHLTALHNRFSLIESKETEVLRDLEQALRLTEDSPQTDSSARSSSDSGKDTLTGTAVSSNETENSTQATTDCLDSHSEHQVTRA